MKKQIKRITAVAAAAALAISFTFPAEPGLADLGVGGNAIAASAASSGNCGDSGSNVTWSLCNVHSFCCDHTIAYMV